MKIKIILLIVTFHACFSEKGICQGSGGEIHFQIYDKDSAIKLLNDPKYLSKSLEGFSYRLVDVNRKYRIKYIYITPGIKVDCGNLSSNKYGNYSTFKTYLGNGNLQMTIENRTGKKKQIMTIDFINPDANLGAEYYFDIYFKQGKFVVDFSKIKNARSIMVIPKNIE
jgi:hypothetical protein